MSPDGDLGRVWEVDKAEVYRLESFGLISTAGEARSNAKARQVAYSVHSCWAEGSVLVIFGMQARELCLGRTKVNPERD
jgi:hypothetical protein